jgi:LacI family transcriptional regulator
MSTIRDVAKRAGVAPITVSRVINRSGPVSEETRRRVQEAIEALSYVPNRLATSLRSDKTNLVALILSDLSNTFWSEITRGIEDTLTRQGYHMILGNSGDSAAREEELLRSLAERRVDGFVLRPADTEGRAVALAQSYGIPIVVLDYAMPGVKVDVVRGDSVGGAHQLTKLLLDLGHRRIAILTGARRASTATMRVAGYRRALDEAGVTVDPALIYYDDFALESGYRMAQKALALCPRPTAILAANNRIAFGTLRALRDAGLRIPEDVSVVGFDELPVETAEHPFLTVAEQSPYHIGLRAAELLVSRMAGDAPPVPQEIVLPAKVVFRQSCGPALRPACHPDSSTN